MIKWILALSLPITVFVVYQYKTGISQSEISIIDAPKSSVQASNSKIKNKKELKFEDSKGSSELLKEVSKGVSKTKDESDPIESSGKVQSKKNQTQSISKSPLSQAKKRNKSPADHEANSTTHANLSSYEERQPSSEPQEEFEWEPEDEPEVSDFKEINVSGKEFTQPQAGGLIDLNQSCSIYIDNSGLTEVSPLGSIRFQIEHYDIPGAEGVVRYRGLISDGSPQFTMVFIYFTDNNLNSVTHYEVIPADADRTLCQL